MSEELDDDKYPLLNMDDFKSIGEQTKYTPNYVRKVVRGYVFRTERNMIIITLADEINELKQKPLK